MYYIFKKPRQRQPEISAQDNSNKKSPKVQRLSASPAQKRLLNVQARIGPLLMMM